MEVMNTTELALVDYSAAHCYSRLYTRIAWPSRLYCRCMLPLCTARQSRVREAVPHMVWSHKPFLNGSEGKCSGVANFGPAVHHPLL